MGPKRDLGGDDIDAGPIGTCGGLGVRPADLGGSHSYICPFMIVFFYHLIILMYILIFFGAFWYDAMYTLMYFL